mmetsp:Transcript_73298/g.164697  ORF Transcript_73298/g.164697 Transcript_73298/m.164697 type:complete len:193 (+) Transcript_73298:88-666(+)
MALAASVPYEPKIDEVDCLAPSWWPTHASKITNNTPPDLLAPGYGAPAEGGTASPYFRYMDAAFSSDITMGTREWLHACWTDADLVKSMIANGADVNASNANGFTGLHMAASKLKLDIAEVLATYGAELNAEEANGMTPLDYCVDAGVDGYSNGKKYIAMVEFLESKGAYRKEECSWLSAANQEQYAPNMPA